MEIFGLNSEEKKQQIDGLLRLSVGETDIDDNYFTIIKIKTKRNFFKLKELSLNKVCKFDNRWLRNELLPYLQAANEYQNAFFARVVNLSSQNVIDAILILIDLQHIILNEFYIVLKESEINKVVSNFVNLFLYAANHIETYWFFLLPDLLNWKTALLTKTFRMESKDGKIYPLQTIRMGRQYLIDIYKSKINDQLNNLRNLFTVRKLDKEYTKKISNIKIIVHSIINIEIESDFPRITLLFNLTTEDHAAVARQLAKIESYLKQVNSKNTENLSGKYNQIGFNALIFFLKILLVKQVNSFLNKEGETIRARIRSLALQSFYLLKKKIDSSPKVMKIMAEIVDRLSIIDIWTLTRSLILGELQQAERSLNNLEEIIKLIAIDNNIIFYNNEDISNYISYLQLKIQVFRLYIDKFKAEQLEEKTKQSRLKVAPKVTKGVPSEAIKTAVPKIVELKPAAVVSSQPLPSLPTPPIGKAKRILPSKEVVSDRESSKKAKQLINPKKKLLPSKGKNKKNTKAKLNSKKNIKSTKKGKQRLKNIKIARQHTNSAGKLPDEKLPPALWKYFTPAQAFIGTKKQQLAAMKLFEVNNIEEYKQTISSIPATEDKAFLRGDWIPLTTPPQPVLDAAELINPRFSYIPEELLQAAAVIGSVYTQSEYLEYTSYLPMFYFPFPLSDLEIFELRRVLTNIPNDKEAIIEVFDITDHTLSPRAMAVLMNTLSKFKIRKLILTSDILRTDHIDCLAQNLFLDSAEATTALLELEVEKGKYIITPEFYNLFISILVRHSYLISLKTSYLHTYYFKSTEQLNEQLKHNRDRYVNLIFQTMREIDSKENGCHPQFQKLKMLYQPEVVNFYFSPLNFPFFIFHHAVKECSPLFVLRFFLEITLKSFSSMLMPSSVIAELKNIYQETNRVEVKECILPYIQKASNAISFFQSPLSLSNEGKYAALPALMFKT